GSPWSDCVLHQGTAAYAIPDSGGGAARPGEPGTTRTAVQIDREIEAARPERSAQSQIVAEPSQTATLRSHDEIGNVRIVLNDWDSRWFDDVSDLRVGVAAPHGTNQRRSEHDVADEAQSHQEDAHLLLFDRGLVYQHHRDVVLDWIDAVTLLAFERRAVVHQLDRRLAVGTGEDFE